MCLRTMRIVRVIRIMRILHLVPNLRMLLISFAFSVKSLGWIIMLVFMTILVFGMIITQIVTYHKVSVGRQRMEEQEKLQELFGSLGSSMLVLYQAISDGIHWSELAEPLMHDISPFLVVVLLVYSLVSCFAMMNVLTAFFCQKVSKAGDEDRQVILLQDMFQEFRACAEGDGIITEDEFMDHLHDPPMQRYLAEMEISADDVKDSHLFQLIDRDGSGGVDVDELMTGCMRLTSPAKGIDVAGIAYDLRVEIQRADSHRQWVEDALGKMLTQ